MHNKDLINKSQEKNKQIIDTKSNLFSVTYAGPLDENKVSIVSKKKSYTSPTSIWTNSIYSFNQNYIKNIPSVDKIVNKLIKSFFTINALANNIRGKKLKLIQRKFKNLSLNRIFVSKSEIKHSNNKVIITVYLFNKKKRSLLLRLNELYSTLSINLAHKSRLWSIKNNFEKLTSKFTNSNFKLSKYDRISNNGYKTSLIQTEKNLSLIANNTNKTSEYLRKIISNRYGFVKKVLKPMSKKNINFLSYKSFRKPVLLSYNKKISYYKRLNNLTKYNLNKFITSMHLQNRNSINNNLVKIINKFFVYTNQYKLYKTSNFITEEKFIQLPSIKSGRRKLITRFNYSMTKLKSVNKVYSLYNNSKMENISNATLNERKSVYAVMKILLLNTSKLLKKSYKRSKFSHTNLSFINTESFFILKNRLKRKNKNSLKYNKSERKYNNVKLLVKKLNRIDRFFKRYENIFLTNNTVLSFSNLNTQLVNNYKVNFINDILQKELLYISYLKLMSYNNIVFKNWFLFPLRSLISKIYNKRIIFNIVNLKYIHLNSDILSQGVDIRLKNFRKNKLVEVLKKAIKLVTISKVNVYACDVHTATYKYINNYYNQFKSLKLNVFKDLGFVEDNSGNNITVNDVYTPCKIRRLNHVQTSTINFIKFKSVFGARLEAAGRLTKRSTASRALFKFRYKGTLKNNTIMNNSLSSTIIKNQQISNLQFTKISSKTRNGSFGLKGWINSN